ncbi:hypothetical protein QBC44DRAFT_398421 [Cladorrhinum sp. PSN332]|nr:hypothetical protein QBC44DRAFT_398421 [Cladorrhinum sp. PSN332]
MDKTGPMDEVRIPLVAHVAPVSRYSHLSDTTDHWDLPEPRHQRDLPQVYIPLLLQNRHPACDVPYSSRTLTLQATPSCTGKTTKPHRASFWRRRWLTILALGILLLAGVIGGGLAGFLALRRRGGGGASSTDPDILIASTTLTSLGSGTLSGTPRTALLSAIANTSSSAALTQDSEVVETTTTRSGIKSTRTGVSTTRPSESSSSHTVTSFSQISPVAVKDTTVSTANGEKSTSDRASGTGSSSTSKMISITGVDETSESTSPTTEASSSSSSSSSPLSLSSRSDSDSVSTYPAFNSSEQEAPATIPSASAPPPTTLIDPNTTTPEPIAPSPTVPPPEDIITPTSTDQQPQTTSTATASMMPHRSFMIGRRRELGASADSEEIAFYPGQECSYSFISKFGVFPCNLPFNIGERWYTWQGCGGPIWVEFAGPNREYVGPCVWNGSFASVNCGGEFEVTGGWVCG